MSQIDPNMRVNANAAEAIDRSDAAASAVSAFKTGGKGTGADVAGASAAASSGAAPALPAPILQGAASMMLALMALNNKLAGEQVDFSSKITENTRDDIRKKGVQRNAQLREYFEKMAQVKENDTQRCGLFGAIAQTFKKLLSGDLEGIGKLWSENIGNILKDTAALVGAAVMTAVAVVALCLSPLSFGATAALSAVCLGCAAAMLVGTVLADPGIQALVQEALPDNPAWLKLAVGIGLSVAGIGANIIGGLSLAVITGVATGGVATVPVLVNSVLGIASAITNIACAVKNFQTGVDNHEQGQIRADAEEISADIDVIEANTERVRQTLTNQQKVFEALYESMASFIESVRALIAASCENSRIAASV
jgi:hypothetical protein